MADVVPSASATSEVTHDGTTIVTLDGDFDLGNMERVRHRLSHLLRDARHDVIVDLRGVSFADSTTLSTLIGARRRVETSHQQLVLVKANEHVWKRFTITGLDRVFSAYDDLALAKAHLAARRDLGERALTS
jgi:anti-sigma B factor antagonist